MKILFLLPDFPFPPTTGGRSKVFNELLYLSSSHECDLLCIGEAGHHEISRLKELLPNVNVIGVFDQPSIFKRYFLSIYNLFRLLPFSLSRYYSSELVDCLRKLLSSVKYDVIHYDIINMAQYIHIGKKIPSVHSPNDATSMVYQRLFEQSPMSVLKLRLMISVWLLRRYEKNIYSKFTIIHVVSDMDKKYLENICEEINVRVIPISCNIYDVDNIMRAIYKKHNIVCAGNFNNYSISKGTEDIIDFVFPSILNKIPDAQLVILGKNASKSMKDKIKHSSNIQYLEFVDDYRGFLSGFNLFLAPDYSGAAGAKTRVLEAMGMGLTVLGTKSAFEGIPIEDGIHGVVYDSVQDCESLLLDIILNEETRTLIGINAKKLISNTFSTAIIGPEYENLYFDAANSVLNQ